MDQNLFTYVMFGVLAIFIIFIFRNSRRSKALREDLRSKIVPGADVMTNFGLHGTLKSIDEVNKIAELEVAPGTVVRVHSQTIAKVVTPEDFDAPKSVEEAMERANREAKLNEDNAIPVGEPKYGERTSGSAAKPARRTAKKTSD